MKFKIEILKQHNIPYYIENNNLYAASMIAYTKQFEKVENITNWSNKKLFDWLGY